MILILGGTAEARDLAGRLVAEGIAVTSSLAGRVANPRLPQGAVRVGGFGGPDRLAAWIRDNGVRGVIDATHPFAERISASAATAAPRASVPLIRLARPGWTQSEDDDWIWVDDLDAAAAKLPDVGRRALLTTGRQGLASFASIDDVWFLIRCVDPPDGPLPAHHEILLDRGPYTVAGEAKLIDGHAIDVVVTKDSGGTYTRAKLDAARERGLPVIVVRRPRHPEVETTETVEGAVAWARAQLG